MYSKKVELQLKDNELEIGTKTRKAINDLKQLGKQKQCYLGIRSFFTTVTTYMQKSLALRNLLLEALAYLNPNQKTGIRSIQKIRVVGSSLPCVKPEEFTLLTDEWRVYAETDIPQEWVQKEYGTPVRIDRYWNQVLQLKTPIREPNIQCACQNCEVCLGSIPWKY